MPFSVILFLIIIVVAVPFLSIQNLKMLDAIKEIVLPNKQKLYIQSAVNQLFLTSIALWAADSSLITINYIGTFSTYAMLGAACFLAIACTLSYISSRNKAITDTNPGLELLTPNTFKEKCTWVMVNLVAASCEEIIFRGVLFQLFLRSTQNYWAAGIISALVFGFAHSVQGIGGILLTAVFGLGLQHIVYLNNGLLVAMLVHFVYNMVTTFLLLSKPKPEVH